MFITLRNHTRPTRTGTGMEQVARKNASYRGSRSSRQRTCIACRDIKLRCSGSDSGCERCKARSIPCSLSASQVKPKEPDNRVLYSRAGSGHEALELEREALSLERPLDVMTPEVPQSENSIMDIETEGLHSSRSLLAEDIQWMMVHHTEDNIASHQTPAESTTPLSSGNPAPCQCEAEIVRVVQQLDDDAFQLSTLPLDRILQLQKWLIFHCCKPLSCPSCRAVATCHTMILLVCDRLTEMFECIHQRIRRYGGVTTAPDDAEPPSTQLFTADGAASKAVCTTLLFSLELSGQYSDEEQVHMIQALLNLSVRNLRRLLARAEEHSKIGGGQARLLRIRSLLARLGKAVEDIDNAFCNVLQSFSLDGDRLA